MRQMKEALTDIIGTLGQEPLTLGDAQALAEVFTALAKMMSAVYDYTVANGSKDYPASTYHFKIREAMEARARIHLERLG